MNALEKIKTGREFFIPDCLVSGDLELVTRYVPITDEEATAIELLAAARYVDLGKTLCSIIRGENIETQFREELIDIRKHSEG